MLLLSFLILPLAANHIPCVAYPTSEICLITFPWTIDISSYLHNKPHPIRGSSYFSFLYLSPLLCVSKLKKVYPSRTLSYGSRIFYLPPPRNSSGVLKKCAAIFQFLWEFCSFFLPFYLNIIKMWRKWLWSRPHSVVCYLFENIWGDLVYLCT